MLLLTLYTWSYGRTIRFNTRQWVYKTKQYEQHISYFNPIDVRDSVILNQENVTKEWYLRKLSDSQFSFWPVNKRIDLVIAVDIAHEDTQSLSVTDVLFYVMKNLNITL